MHLAVYNKRTEIVKYLIEQCQQDPSALDEFKQTPLTYACQGGDLEMATYLVEQMKDMRMEDILYYDYEARDSSIIHSPLGCACYGGHLTLVKYLIEDCGCDPSRTESGDKSKTPLRIAVLYDHANVVQYLVSLGLSQTIQAEESQHLVHLAVDHQNLDMVKSLTQSLHYDPNRNYKGISLLLRAAASGNLSIVKYLTSIGCDPNIESVEGFLPIHTAAGHNENISQRNILVTHQLYLKTERLLSSVQ